jgi:hypothetical protein
MAVYAHPSVLLTLSATSVKVGAKVDSTISVYLGAKTLLKALWYMNGIAMDNVCSNPPCSFVLGPFNVAGKTNYVYAKAYFTDGTSVVSATKTVSVQSAAEPKISMTLSPTNRAIMTTDTATLAASVDPAGKSVTHLSLYANDVVVKSCAGATACSFSALASSLFSANETYPATLKYYGKVSFTDGSSYTTAVGEPTIYSEIPN